MIRRARRAADSQGGRSRAGPMGFGLITDQPDHPVLAEVAVRLAHAGRVVIVDAAHKEPGGVAAANGAEALDVYLLKAHSTPALELARRLEERGRRVVNPPRATGRALDRLRMTSAALAAALPFPPMTWVGTVAELTDHLRDRPTRAPLVVKSRWSRRGDVVACVTDSHDLDAQCAAADEPVIVQKFHDNDGWDYKLYVVGARVLAVRRRSPLGPGSGSKIGVHVASLPSQWVALARTTGKVFGLEVYGVDLLHTRDGPLIVDVNPFPGGRGVDGMASALAELAEWHADDARARGESSISPAP